MRYVAASVMVPVLVVPFLFMSAQRRPAADSVQVSAADDSKYLKHTLAYRKDDGPPRIKYKDVVITKWPPGKRVYGADAPETAAPC